MRSRNRKILVPFFLKPALRLRFLKFLISSDKHTFYPLQQVIATQPGTRGRVERENLLLEDSQRIAYALAFHLLGPVCGRS